MGRVPPETSDWEISADLSGKERQGKKQKWSRKEGKSRTGRWKNANGMRKVVFVFVFVFVFCFSLFKTDWNLFWVNQNGNYLLGKSISRQGKNQEKLICPLKKIFLLRPWGKYK